MKLVFIHGRDQQGKSFYELRELWESSLRIGLGESGHPWPANTEVVFPYYGDRLIELQAEIDGPTTAVAKGSPTTNQGLIDFQFEALTEIANAAGVSDADIRAHLDEGPAAKGVMNWGWVQALLRAVEEKGKFGEGVLSHVTRDVFLYLTNQNVRDGLHALVGEALAGSEPKIVVAHSLGTVLAYEMLARAPKDSNVLALITLGSPLGLKTVRKFVRRPLEKPECVAVWKNAYDPSDVVALYPLDKSTWNIEPPIENHSAVVNHSDNRHGIVGYLDDQVVADWIYRALTEVR